MDENIGKIFNKLKVIKFEYKDKFNNKHYLFECECGNKKIINIQNVKTGKTKSCGCNYKEILGKLYKKINKYRIYKNYVIGYTTNTNKKFYIDLEDYEKIKNISWYETKNNYIAHKGKNKKIILLHRYIMNEPKGKIIDHINHNKNDNRKNNLRIVNYKENALNRTKKPKGITKLKRNNNYYYIVQLGGYKGCYKKFEEALKIRNKIINENY